MVMELYIVIAVAVVVVAIFLYRKKAVKKVPQGLQVFDANGDIVFDVNDYAFEVYGIVTTTAKVAGSVSDSRIKKSTCVFMMLSAKHPNFNYSTMSAYDYYYEQMFSALPRCCFRARCTESLPCCSVSLSISCSAVRCRAGALRGAWCCCLSSEW